MPHDAINTGAMRSRKRMVGREGQRRRELTMPTGTARIKPPNDDSPPCHMANTWRGWAEYCDQLGATLMMRAPTMAAMMTHRNIPVTHCHS